MNQQIRLSEEEVEINNNLYKKRIEYLVKLGEVKLAEITNEKITEETYFNLIELKVEKFSPVLREVVGLKFISVSNPQPNPKPKLPLE